MMTKETILIVEDEPDIRDLLAFNLSREGYAVLEAADGHRAVAVAIDKKPDMILLDLMLPGMDGLAACKSLQRRPDTAGIPVIMLTAKGEEVDRIVGLEIGASDYIVKPFSVREVILRIKAVLRRGEPRPEASAVGSGEISLDSAAHSASVGGTLLDLTITEFRLLEDLLRNKGKVRSREQLLSSVWGYSFDGYARTVDTHVRRLRGKLEDAADIIETVRGVGYRAKE